MDRTDILDTHGNANRYAWVHVLNAALLLALWGFALWAWQHLPDRVPGHIGLSGVTRWERREGGTWFLMPLLGTFHVLLMYVLSVAAGNNASGFNVPRRKRLLALPPEGQRYAMQPVRLFMYGMATWLLVLSLWVQVHIYRIAMAPQVPPGRSLLAGTIVMTAAVLLGAVLLGRASSRRIDAWESRDPS
jgi:uncharacterized membrane protein